MLKQTNAQKIGRMGERWFPQQLPTDWIFQPPNEDIGVDGVVVVCDNSRSNGLEFRVQIKSSENWEIKNESILIRVNRSNLEYWLSGFSPTLIVLYDSSNNVGWYSWVNQLIAEDISVLKNKSKSILLKIPLNQKIETCIWDRISRQVLSLYLSISKKIGFAGMAVPIMKTTQHLTQSLYLIDLCSHNWPEDYINLIYKKRVDLLNAHKDGQLIRDLVDAETTAHKEIAMALIELDKQLASVSLPLTGAKEAGKKYSEICSRFITDFDKYVRYSGPGFKFSVDIVSMVKFRAQAIREVINIVNKLMTLTLSITEEK